MKLENETCLSAWKHACICQTRLKAHHCVNRGGLIQCVCVAAVHYCNESSGKCNGSRMVCIREEEHKAPRPGPNPMDNMHFMTYMGFEITRLASYACLLCRSHLIPKMPFKMNLSKNILKSRLVQRQKK